jgi:cob(I)alamin adenosyltransferase
MAEISATPENAARFRVIDNQRVEWLETQINHIGTLMEMPREFILPGDSLAGAAFALARTVIRRAERRVAELYHAKEIENQALLQYLNRLSSLCFLLELDENRIAGTPSSLAKDKRTSRK